MKMYTDDEISTIDDVFENNEVVLIKATHSEFNTDDMIEYSVGLKDEVGDIVKIITVARKFV
jgi:hypothetical protein